MVSRVTSQRAARHVPGPPQEPAPGMITRYAFRLRSQLLATHKTGVYMRPMSSAARLLDRHPLLRRLSGQAIWNLLEEEGLPEARINDALDSFEAAKAACVDLLRRAADPAERATRPWVLLRLDPAAPACPDCAALRHGVVAADHPDLAIFLPPFGLGCALSAELVGDAALAGLAPAARPLERERLPACGIFCAARGLGPAASCKA